LKSDAAKKETEMNSKIQQAKAEAKEEAKEETKK